MLSLKKKNPKCFYSLTSRFNVMFSSVTLVYLESVDLNKDTCTSNPA